MVMGNTYEGGTEGKSTNRTETIGEEGKVFSTFHASRKPPKTRVKSLKFPVCLTKGQGE